ncbi:unnamed protein product, partial [Rotaria magnacalcarata]
IADPPWNAADNDRFLLDIHIYPRDKKHRTYRIIEIRKIQSDDSYRRLLKNVQLEKPLPIFHRNRKLHQFHFAFIQLAIERNRYPYVDHVFNEQILNLVSLQRAKCLSRTTP